MVPSFGTVFVYASFKLKQQEIIDTICVQRKMIFNACNGRCQLQKSLKQYEDNEKKMQDSLKDKIELVYVQNTVDFDLNIFSAIELKDNPSILFEKKPVGANDLIFHPPLYFV